MGAPRAYHGGPHHEIQTVNDLPVPEGDWQEHYNARNRTYNGVLAAGIVAFGVTLTLVSLFILNLKDSIYSNLLFQVINSGLIELQSKPPKTYE